MTPRLAVADGEWAHGRRLDLDLNRPRAENSKSLHIKKLKQNRLPKRGQAHFAPKTAQNEPVPGGFVRVPKGEISLRIAMNRAVVCITGLHVLIHSIFGCCDHAFAAFSESVGGHVCSHAVTKCDEAALHEHGHHDAVAAHNDECEQSCKTGISDQQSAPHQRHDCRHDSCHWLTSEALPDIELLDSHCDTMYVPTTGAAIASLPASGFWPETDVGRYHAPTLRLHLALGVLLI